jgi:hypothetical protein
LGVLVIGLAACGSSSPPPQSKAPPAAVGGGPTTMSGMDAAAPLLGSVTDAVPGLSTSQAATGTGSLLGLAQAKMPPDQFSQIQSALPGTDALIGGAQKAGLPSSAGLTGLSSLNGVFTKAGISPTQVQQIIPVMSNAISKSGNPALAQSFISAVR